MSSYPCGKEIFKELLQNADDAGATQVHFVKDCRHHPTVKVKDLADYATSCMMYNTLVAVVYNILTVVYNIFTVVYNILTVVYNILSEVYNILTVVYNILTVVYNI